MFGVLFFSVIIQFIVLFGSVVQCVVISFNWILESHVSKLQSKLKVET